MNVRAQNGGESEAVACLRKYTEIVRTQLNDMTQELIDEDIKNLRRALQLNNIDYDKQTPEASRSSYVRYLVDLARNRLPVLPT